MNFPGRDHPTDDQVEAAKFAIRKGLTDRLQNPDTGGEFDVDVLLRGCEHALHSRGYEHPEDAAEILASDAARAALTAAFSLAPAGTEPAMKQAILTVGTTARWLQDNRYMRMGDDLAKAYVTLSAPSALLPPQPSSAELPGKDVGDRDYLGRKVREAWVQWALSQPNPKPSWLVPYDELPEPDKEADRQIGEAIAALVSQPHPEGAVPDFWAVHSATGMDVGLWADEGNARSMAVETDTITPLYLHPAHARSRPSSHDRRPSACPQYARRPSR